MLDIKLLPPPLVETGPSVYSTTDCYIISIGPIVVRMFGN